MSCIGLPALADDAPAPRPPASEVSAAPEAAVPRESQRLSAEAYMRRGFEYLARPRPEDMENAERLFRKALKSDAGLPGAHAGLSRVAAYRYTLGLDESPEVLDMALGEAHRAVELGPDDGPSRVALAVALAAADRLTPALQEARLAVDLAPESYETHLAVCGVLRLRRETDAALDACGRAAALAPDSQAVLTGLGDVLRQAERFREALEMYGQAIDLDHEAIAPQLGAAAALYQMKNGGHARGMYNVLLSDWDYGERRSRLGAAALLVAMGTYEQALAMYEAIDLPADGRLPTLLALYGKAYALHRLGRDAEAEYFLSTLIERVPADYDGPAQGRETLFRAYGDLIDYFTRRDRPRRVLSLLREACGRPMAPTQLARRLATRLEEDGKTDAAAATLEKALLGADPDEDPIELSESVLQLVRLRSAAGSRRIREESEAGHALAWVAAQVAESPLGIAHYRLARARALARDADGALDSLRSARSNGYLPIDQMSVDPDFAVLRDRPEFRALLAH